jgi:phage baseplate assembly protein W
MAIKISRKFKDISFSFSRNPITNDILVLQNEDAIKKSVINLVRTQIGERFFNRLIGTSLSKTIFELNTQEAAYYLEDEIKLLLENFEPRVKVIAVDSDIDLDSNDLNIKMQYDIIGLAIPTQNIEFLLQPTRL